MFSDNFHRCFENFFQHGTDPFFRTNVSISIPRDFGTSTNTNHRMNSNRSNNNHEPSWSVDQAMGRRRGNEVTVPINHNRLNWYDSYNNRALAPLPSVPARSVFLNRDELLMIKTEIYKQPGVESSFEDDTCDICLETFKNGTKLKVLPCKHKFHINCIDKWLMLRPVCPRCRAGVRAGLKKQQKPDQRNRMGAVTRINVRRTENQLTDEEIDRRRRQNNEFYLKKRQKRLENQSKIQSDKNNEKPKEKPKLKAKEPITSNINSETIDNHNKIILNNNKDENITDSNQIDENILHDGMNIARAKAVTAALRRLEINNCQPDQTESCQ